MKKYETQNWIGSGRYKKPSFLSLKIIPRSTPKHQISFGSPIPSFYIFENSSTFKQSRTMDSTRNNFGCRLGGVITTIRSKMSVWPTPTRGENDGSYPPPTCPSCGQAYPCSCT